MTGDHVRQQRMKPGPGEASRRASRAREPSLDTAPRAASRVTVLPERPRPLASELVARDLVARELSASAGAPGYPFVSVIIPHYNDLANLPRCLALVERQTWPRDRFEIIVADNNSRCGIEAVRAAAPGAIVVAAPIQGAGPARNAGVAVARGEVLAFCDSDCFAEPSWIEGGVGALRRFDYAGGEVITDVADPRHLSLAEAYEAVFAFNFRKYIEQDKFSGTGNLFVPRRVFEATGPFRAGVSEDKEWCHRANAAGFRLGYEPAAVVAHPARRTWDELCLKWQRVVRESYLLAREKPGWKLRWLARTVAVAASPIPHAARVLRHARLPGLRNKAMGLAGLIGIRGYRAWLMLRALAGRL